MQPPIDYAFAGALLLLALLLSLAMIAVPEVVTRALKLRKHSVIKNQPYECGVAPVGSARVRFSIRFYMVAMLFILFDIEAIFFYPWLTVHRWLGLFGLIEMFIFVGILMAGYVYLWRRGGFEWE